MKVLFLNPPSFMGFDGGAGSRYQARREIRSFWYPAWLAYAAGLVKDSLLIDAPPAGMDLEKVLCLGKGFDLLVIHTSTPTIKNDAAVAEKFKSTYPGMQIGFVGPHAITLPDETLKASKAIDFVCTGEFDYPIAEIAQGKPLQEVSGVAFLKEGKFTRTPDRPPIQNLDALPFVTDVYARHLKIENYHIGYLDHPYLSIYTGRGCAARCTFCLWPQTIGGRTYRTRSAENVYEEIARAKRILPNVKEFFFDDDTFTGNLPRAEEIAKKLSPLGIKWSVNARANVPYKTLKALKDAGLNLLVVGFESGNQQILNNVKKGINIEQAKEFVKAAKDIGILIHGTFILGLPGETRETMEETLRFAKETDPYSLQVSLAAPYPGTELYRQALKEGWLSTEKESLVEAGIQTAVLAYSHLPKEEIFEMLERF